MEIIFSDQNIPNKIQKSIFLAGPSPRGMIKDEWRHEALLILSNYNYQGTVFIPIPKDLFYGNRKLSEPHDYTDQLSWEVDCRKIADKIVFWIPRDIKNGFPGFTTNVEFGEDLNTGRVMYGRPDNADNIRYLDGRFAGKGVIHNTLDSLLSDTLISLGSGAIRRGIEVSIPLNIWTSYRFQNWYKNFDSKYDGGRIEIKYAEFSSDNICRAIIANVHSGNKHKTLLI